MHFLTSVNFPCYPKVSESLSTSETFTLYKGTTTFCPNTINDELSFSVSLLFWVSWLMWSGYHYFGEADKWRYQYIVDTGLNAMTLGCPPQRMNDIVFNHQVTVLICAKETHKS